MIEALVWKYGLKNGLVVTDGVIQQWPQEWPDQPSAAGIAQIEAEYAQHLVAAGLPAYAKSREEEALTVGDFTEDFTEENRRNMKEAVDLLERLPEEVRPAGTTWRSRNHGDQVVTLEVMVTWLITGGLKRHKRYEVEAALAGQTFETIEELEAAFDALYEAT